MIEVEESELPGVGMCYRFGTGAGERLEVVAHRSGERELLLGSREDPDTYRIVLELSAEESRTLAEILTAATQSG